MLKYCISCFLLWKLTWINVIDPAPAGWIDWVPGFMLAVVINFPWSNEARDVLLVTWGTGEVTTGIAVVPKATTLGYRLINKQ